MTSSHKVTSILKKSHKKNKTDFNFVGADNRKVNRVSFDS